MAPNKVGYNDKISKYIGPGALQIVAFVDVVDKYPPFRADGLALTPADIPDNPIVGWFLAAIVADYERRGWKVVL
ncbi:hypothetical protein L2252_24310 [Mesorhizobium muleiense]|nr:hypothetical protein [Mesorhizobium muleiense]